MNMVMVYESYVSTSFNFFQRYSILFYPKQYFYVEQHETWIQASQQGVIPIQRILIRIFPYSSQSLKFEQ